MSERSAIARSERPATVHSLAADLAALGVTEGMTLMVHSSLSALGYVAGGAQSVVEALRQAVGAHGTLMMPTHSADLSDPAAWMNPPIPKDWWDTVRDTMPAYDPATTPTRGMGAIVECFRSSPDATRSAHPTVSACAVGSQASQLTADHTFASGLGDGSPQARLYELDGSVLLLGVGHGNNTSLHLSEHRAAPSHAPRQTVGSPMLVDGEREWVTAELLAEDESDFARIGEAFARTGLQATGQVGLGTAHLMRCRDIVDHGVAWMQRYRTWSGD